MGGGKNSRVENNFWVFNTINSDNVFIIIIVIMLLAFQLSTKCTIKIKKTLKKKNVKIVCKIKKTIILL